MGKTLTIKKLEAELESVLTANETMKAAAHMVGFDIESETNNLLANADQRVRVDIHQRGRINTLKSLIEDLREPS